MQLNTLNNLAFGTTTVTLSEKNLGRKIKRDVVGTFNEEVLPQMKKTQKADAEVIIQSAGGAGRVIKKPEDFQNNVNFFALGAGSGSRFRELAQTVGDYNKISLPFKTDGKRDFRMLDCAMAMGNVFTGDEGVNTIVATKPTGSFGDIVQHYLDGNEIKDTVVCCGDNVFGDSAKDMMTFVTKAINDPKKHLALFGVKKPLSESLEADGSKVKFGVLTVEGDSNSDVVKLTGFREKPPVDEAREIADKNGDLVVNTGMFYISKEAMAHIVDEVKNGENNIKKSDSEPYDFAEAVKYTHKKTQDWFGIPSKEAADVKIVKKWEDIGAPDALYRAMDDMRENGTYLQNLPRKYSDAIRDSFDARVHLDKSPKYINFSNNPYATDLQVAQAKEVDGVKIVTDNHVDVKA